MVLTSDGEILTNHHVVEGATSISVEVVSTGQTYDAEVEGYDSTHDVAVLQHVGAPGLTPVTTDTAEQVAAGDRVTGVGNANGDGGAASAAAAPSRRRTRRSRSRARPVAPRVGSPG
ncbi:MAG: septum formation initiator [Aeromicrobium sp.]|nr:septum formation initiator [Aeromicrobium sp.]